MGHVLKILLVQSVMTAMTLGLPASADAGYCKGRYCKAKRYSDEPEVYRYVTAEKTLGVGIVTAPVRPGRWGMRSGCRAVPGSIAAGVAKISCATKPWIFGTTCRAEPIRRAISASNSISIPDMSIEGTINKTRF